MVSDKQNSLIADISATVKQAMITYSHTQDVSVAVDNFALKIGRRMRSTFASNKDVSSSVGTLQLSTGLQFHEDIDVEVTTGFALSLIMSNNFFCDFLHFHKTALQCGQKLYGFMVILPSSIYTPHQFSYTL